MKKFLSGLWALVLPLFLFAQPTLEESARVEALLSRLPYPELQSGFLYDRAPGLARLPHYAMHPDEFPQSAIAFWLAVKEMRAAGKNVLLPGGPDLDKTILASRERPSHTFPLAILDLGFFSLSDSAHRSGKLLHDSLGFFPAPGVGFKEITDAYRINLVSLLALSALPERVVLRADSRFWFSDREISGIRATIGSASPMILLPGDSLEWFPTRQGGLQVEVVHGTKVLFKQNLGSGPETQSIEEQKRADDDPWWAEHYKPCGGIRSTAIMAEIPFQGYEAGDFPMHGIGEYSLYLAKNNSGACDLASVRKPMILLDGFDPLDERKAECLYGKYLRYKHPEGGDRLLGDLARDEENQYDLIILNFTQWNKPIGGVIEGGADYIERNAMVLISLIAKINQAMEENGSHEKLVIAGPSMGGLISRYALSYMEKHGMDHRCRLWISFDSPHLGANIPLSVQSFVKYFALEGNSKAAKKVLDFQLGSVAARQMLLVHHTYAVAHGPNPVFRPKFVHNLTQNGLPGSGGWPTQCRKVSLVNGSLQGQKFGEGCALGNALRVKVVSQGMPLLTSLFQPFVPPVEPVDATLRTMPEQAECTVFTAKLPGVPRVKLPIPPFQIGHCSIDQAPGGALDIFGSVGGRTGGGNGRAPMPFDISSIMEYQVLTSGNWVRSIMVLFFGEEVDNPSIQVNLGGNSFGFGVEVLFSPEQINACFIPTKSALAYHWKEDWPGVWDEVLNNRDLACRNETPFDATFGEAFNTDHVSLTQAKVEWLMEQMNSPSPPDGNGVSIDLKGTPSPCPYTRERFSIVNPKTGSTYLWSSPTGISMEEPGPGLSKTLGFESSSQPSSMRFVVEDPECPTLVVERPVVPTGAYRSYSISRLSPVCPGKPFRFTVEGAEPGSWYYFSASDNQGNLYPVENDGPTGTFLLPDEALFPIQLECIVAHNSCSNTSRINLVPDAPQPVPDFQLECQGPGGYFCYGQSPIRFAIPLGDVPPGSFIHWIPETQEPGSAIYTMETEMSYGLNRSATFHLTNPGSLVFRVRVEVGCSWKERLFRFDFQNPAQMVVMPNGQMCYSCQAGMLWIQVQPNPLVQGPDAELRLTSGWEPVLPVRLVVKDVRGKSVLSRSFHQGPFLLNLKDLLPAEYRIEMEDARFSQASTTFYLLENADQKLSISPNPAWIGQDEAVKISILKDLDAEDSWQYSIQDGVGKSILETKAGSSITLPIRSLKPGSFFVEVSNGDTVLDQVLLVEQPDLPRLRLLPIPVETDIRVTLENMKPHPSGYEVLVRDKMGLVRKRARKSGETFSLDLSDLPAEVYHIQITDPEKVVGRMFRKE
jgi:hypothetical protein